MMKYLNKAFTLVELIVVVTILAILSTIWFVAYNDYLWWTRDTNRISQIKSISDAIQLYNTHNLIPVPDNNVEIRLWTKIIWYQWYAWENILESIEYTWEWLDPKDNNFFTFNITSNRKYFSILSLLEDDWKTKWNITMGSWLFANNYHPIVYRMSERTKKLQYLVFANKWHEKLDDLYERVLKNPFIIRK